MKSAIKQKITLPALKERAVALLKELLEASVEEQCEVLKAWQEGLDEALDLLAEARRPPGVPVGYIRQQMDIRSAHCKCQAIIQETDADMGQPQYPAGEQP